MKKPKFPSLYQINTRVWLTELSRKLGKQCTLDDIPEIEFDRFAEMGFDWIWFLSVWTTGAKGKKISCENPEWRHEFEETLPDLTDDDIGGSGFAIAAYEVDPRMGGAAALKRVREKLKKRGMKLMLDFVPNHMGPDHPWADDHPDYFVPGTVQEIESSPQNYTWVKSKQGDIILAYGRDPYFSGWPDTLQLDYSNPSTQEAMQQELLRIASQCDGVRCDMAMLVLPDIFERTWGRKTESFWPKATASVREKFPDFTFMAEVYWDMEWTLQQQGFNYTYDKRLYDRLRDGGAGEVRGHMYADLDYQFKSARFLENHDEPRAASTFNDSQHKAAAIITFLSPGLRFFHQGQFEGKKKRISPHLIRGPVEPVNEELLEFYKTLLSAISRTIYREGGWRLLHCSQSWTGDYSSDAYLAFVWEGINGEMSLAVVNYSNHAGQCYIQLPFAQLKDQTAKFKDLMSDAIYDRVGTDVLSSGMYFDMPAWGYHIFEIVIPASPGDQQTNITSDPKKMSEKFEQEKTGGIEYAH